MIEAPILIFTNSSNNYSIRVLEDNILRVCYKTGPKGWMDQILFAEFFVEPCTFQANIHGHRKFIWVDNYTGHNITRRLTVVLKAKYSTLKYLPPCSTHLCQSEDTFIISKVKDAWMTRWKAKK